MEDEVRIYFITIRGCWCSKWLLCCFSSTGSREVSARFDWCTGPALPPQRSANGMHQHSSFSPIVTGACALGRLEEDISPSPDTGQHGLPALCAGMFAQGRRVGWLERFLADFSCSESPRPRTAWRPLPALVWQLQWFFFLLLSLV